MARAKRTRRPKAARRGRKRPVRLRVSHTPKFRRWLRSVATETYFLQAILALFALWLLFAAGIYLAEQGVATASITTYGEALYWGIAAFSTAGIADTPASGLARLIGGIWIIVGSALFFGILVATITSYFMRPVQRPARRIIETVEYNLEHMQDLTLEELDLLKETVDTLIEHMEHVRSRRHGAE